MKPTNSISSKPDVLFKAIQRIITACAECGLPSPYDVLVRNEIGGEAGFRCFHDRTEPLPNLPKEINIEVGTGRVSRAITETTISASSVSMSQSTRTDSM